MTGMEITLTYLGCALLKDNRGESMGFTIIKQIYRCTLGKLITWHVNARDQKRGLDFSREVDTKEGVKYGAPSTARTQHIVRKYFGDNITEEDSIIDIGCGKGRMLAFFAEFPFKQICGLEYVQEMVDIAKNNMGVLGLGGGVKIIAGDARVYEDLDQYNYFYMSNPFWEDDIMVALIKNIKKSISRNNRMIHIIYNNPRQENILISQGLVLEKEMPVFFNTKVNVYTFSAQQQTKNNVV